MSAIFQLCDSNLEDETALVVPPSSGAMVTFCGRVRDNNEGRAVKGLEYSSYPELALKEGRRIVEEALRRFGVERIRALHRVGFLHVGDAAILVDVASGHRGEGFEACRWVVDEIKHRVPIWKKEQYVEGDSEWVMCHHSHAE